MKKQSLLIVALVLAAAFFYAAVNQEEPEPLPEVRPALRAEIEQTAVAYYEKAQAARFEQGILTVAIDREPNAGSYKGLAETYYMWFTEEFPDAVLLYVEIAAHNEPAESKYHETGMGKRLATEDGDFKD